MTTLIVSNLPRHVCDTRVRNLFASYGSVTQVSFMDAPWSGRGSLIAFIDMDAHADAELAATMLHRREIGGRSITVETYAPAW